MPWNPKSFFLQFLYYILCVCSHIPQLPLAALQTIPGLKHACLTKLACQRQRHLQALLNCLETLEIALCSLSEAVSQVTAISQIEDSQPMLRGGPVFTSLTLITTMLQRIESMYEAELAIKKVVAEDFRNACAQAEQRANTSSPNSFKYLSNLSNTSKQLSSSTDNRTSANSTISANSTSGQISNGGSRSGDEVESFLQVHITAWMLSAEIDEGGVEADLAFITQDANSC